MRFGDREEPCILKMTLTRLTATFGAKFTQAIRDLSTWRVTHLQLCISVIIRTNISLIMDFSVSIVYPPLWDSPENLLLPLTPYSGVDWPPPTLRPERNRT